MFQTVSLSLLLCFLWSAWWFSCSPYSIGFPSPPVIPCSQVQKEMENSDQAVNLARKFWLPNDPTLISEAIFATANIFSSLKLIYIFRWGESRGGQGEGEGGRKKEGESRRKQGKEGSSLIGERLKKGKGAERRGRNWEEVEGRRNKKKGGRRGRGEGIGRKRGGR